MRHRKRTGGEVSDARPPEKLDRLDVKFLLLPPRWRGRRRPSYGPHGTNARQHTSHLQAGIVVNVPKRRRTSNDFLQQGDVGTLLVDPFQADTVGGGSLFLHDLDELIGCLAERHIRRSAGVKSLIKETVAEVVVNPGVLSILQFQEGAPDQFRKQVIRHGLIVYGRPYPLEDFEPVAWASSALRGSSGS